MPPRKLDLTTSWFTTTHPPKQDTCREKTGTNHCEEARAHPVLQRESGISVLGILALVLVRLAGA
jgi:hypothetical protein